MLSSTNENGDANGNGKLAYTLLAHDQDIAKQVGREIHVLPLDGKPAESLVKLAREGHYDLLIVGLPPDAEHASWATPAATEYLRRHAHCAVCLVAPPLVPTMVLET